MILEFPEKYDSKVWFLHFSFIIQYARLAGIDVHIIPQNDQVKTAGKKMTLIFCLLDGRPLIFDYLDHPHRDESHLHLDCPYFKMQYDPNQNKSPNAFPIGPMFALARGRNVEQQLFQYFNIYNNQCDVKNSKILNKQRASNKRRVRVQHELEQWYAPDLDITTADLPVQYWTALNECFISVCVPGATENSFDRNQMEAIGLGVCVISPQIDIELPYKQRLIPGTHYIACQRDFSDIRDKIEWCKSNPKTCAEIGNNAKRLFAEYCTPEKHWEWIVKCVDNFNTQ